MHRSFRLESRLPSPSVFQCVKIHNIAYVVLVCSSVNASWSNVFVDHTTILAAEDACLPAPTSNEIIDLLYFPLDVVEDALAQGADGLGLMKNKDHQEGVGLDELKHDLSTEESMAQKCKDAIVENKCEIIRVNIKPNKAGSKEVADLDPNQLPTSDFVVLVSSIIPISNLSHKTFAHTLVLNVSEFNKMTKSSVP
ncbi:hypothetical protein Tco_0285973 [Tanacetum coccineum]